MSGVKSTYVQELPLAPIFGGPFGNKTLRLCVVGVSLDWGRPLDQTSPVGPVPVDPQRAPVLILRTTRKSGLSENYPEKQIGFPVPGLFHDFCQFHENKMFPRIGHEAIVGCLAAFSTYYEAV